MTSETGRLEWLKRWLFALLALVVPLLVVYHALFLWRCPVPELFLLWDKPSVVSGTIPGGGAEAAGVQPGDVILDVDGAPFPGDQLSLQVGQTVTLGIERDGRRFELDVPLIPLAEAAPLFLVSSVIPALAYWGGSTWLLWRRFRQVEVRLLFVLCQAIAVALLFPPPPFLPWCHQAFWSTFLSVACIFLTPSLLLHFHVTFPVILGTPGQRRRFSSVLYALALLAAVGWLAYTALGIVLAWQISILYAVVQLFAVVVILIYVYFRRATPDGRRRLRIIIPCVFLSVFPVALIYAQSASFGGLGTTLEWLMRLLLLVAPLGYLYAIVRHNLFDIDRMLNRAVVYALLSLGILALYLGPLLLLYRFLPDDLLAQLLIVAGLTLLVGLGFNRARQQVQHLVDLLFYGGWYDYPGVIETISSTLSRTLDRQQLVDVLTRQVPEMMQLRAGQLWIGEPDAAPRHGGDDARLQFPLRFQDQWRGTWMVGQRRDGDDFTPTDRRILKTLAHQAEIALGNVLLVETLRRRLEEIREAQHQLLRSREEERARLARDLHDGPIQALAGLNLQLGLLRSSSAEGAPLAGELAAMRAEVRDLLAELRQVCAELRPPMLDTLGLGAAIRALVEEWSAQNDTAVRLELPPDATLRSLPGEVAVNLYRVVQEALTNIARHAAANQVTLRLIWESPRLTLSVQDDGRGFAVPAVLQSLAGQGHFGLAGMKERIDLIGGTWSLESLPDQGTTMRVTWQAPD